ncbi:hypothetical protein FH972_016544 [Carpinus fangiana]|uniref:Uncharacterized protein n=1 Tax=Carpinus fangiana TaxID=176857 RepID=A0A5N6RJJ1_9ROSI|nr:hypothetical protein FH972_016544 [Carpinus fangiana]
MPDMCLSPSLSLLGSSDRTLRKLFEPKKFLKLHVRCPDAATPPSYAAHLTDQTTTSSPSPTNAATTKPNPRRLDHTATAKLNPRRKFHAAHAAQIPWVDHWAGGLNLASGRRRSNLASG